MNTYTAELEFAKQLAKKAGTIMLKYFRGDMHTVAKKDITPLTIADTIINQLVIDAVRKTYPDYGIIGEEGNGGNAEGEFQWICDPIDGTIPYTIHLPTSMFSLALYRNKKPILGVTYEPYLDSLFWAVAGGAAYRNDAIISVKPGTLQPGDVVGAISHVAKFDVSVNCARLSYALNSRMIMTNEFHSIVYMASLVAGGNIKCMVASGAHLWDRAAIKIIIESAGGRICDEKGNDLDPFIQPKYLILSNKEALPEIVSLAQTYVEKV